MFVVLLCRYLSSTVAHIVLCVIYVSDSENNQTAYSARKADNRYYGMREVQ